jgi:hypothetical protein
LDLKSEPKRQNPARKQGCQVNQKKTENDSSNHFPFSFQQLKSNHIRNLTRRATSHAALARGRNEKNQSEGVLTSLPELEPFIHFAKALEGR